MQLWVPLACARITVQEDKPCIARSHEGLWDHLQIQPICALGLLPVERLDVRPIAGKHVEGLLGEIEPRIPSHRHAQDYAAFRRKQKYPPANSVRSP
jgi:hypothetical protein